MTQLNGMFAFCVAHLEGTLITFWKAKTSPEIKYIIFELMTLNIHSSQCVVATRL